jgi:hypothetical protein
MKGEYMDCPGVCKRLSAYLDNELPAKERMQVEAHLRTCVACRAELAALRGIDARLQLLPVEPVSPDFRARFWQRVRSGEQLPAPGLFERLLRRWAPVPVVAAAGIIVFSVVTTVSPLLYGIPLQEVRGDMARLAATASGYSAGSAFGPANFARFCDACREMLCACCADDGGSAACPVRMEEMTHD